MDQNEQIVVKRKNRPTGLVYNKANKLGRAESNRIYYEKNKDKHEKNIFEQKKTRIMNKFNETVEKLKALGIVVEFTIKT